MSEIDLNSGLVGAVVPTIVAALFWFYKRMKGQEEKTLSKILDRLESDKDREVIFREEWGSFKKELMIISRDAKIVSQASEEIIILKRNLDTAFKKIDEVRAASHELHQSIGIVRSLKDQLECFEMSQDNNFTIVLGRLHLLRKAVEALGGVVLNADWIEPMKLNDEGKK